MKYINRIAMINQKNEPKASPITLLGKLSLNQVIKGDHIIIKMTSAIKYTMIVFFSIIPPLPYYYL